MDAADILSYNAELASYVLENPTESLPLVCHSFLSRDGRLLNTQRPTQCLSFKQGQSSMVLTSSHTTCLQAAVWVVAC